MPDTKISALTAATAAAGANEIAINEAGTSKKISVTQLVTLLQTLGMARTKRVAADYSNSTTTGIKVTDLDIALEIGTYSFRYCLIIQSSAAATGLAFGVNFTGTQTSFNVVSYFLSTGTTASSGVIQGDTVGSAEGLIEGFGTRTVSTTAPDIGPHTGVGSANVDNLNLLEGIIKVTVAGNLELWHGSETAAATIVATDSSLVVVRTA